ncbi:MAG: pyridoxamine kinase [Clostridia bacterium]|nr:pyridoxamine kinase [Clostridia bacterium]
MDYKRVLTIQDISCVGQCSLTVALPIISACGVETAVLPSSVLSTHTGGFSGYTFRDLTDDIPAIEEHWQKEGITFDALYTGYLGSTRQIDMVSHIMETCLKDGAKTIVDPAMADNGKLYYGFDSDFVKAMATLCGKADIIVPNITEACFMTGVEYKTEYDRAYIDTILSSLIKMGAKTVILTGVTYNDETTGVVVFENGEYSYYEHKKLPGGCHGTGDVYASAFTGALMRGFTTFDAAALAADYTLLCIEKTLPDIKKHWYGVKFETCIPELVSMINK